MNDEAFNLIKNIKEGLGGEAIILRPGDAKVLLNYIDYLEDEGIKQVAFKEWLEGQIKLLKAFCKESDKERYKIMLEDYEFINKKTGYWK